MKRLRQRGRLRLDALDQITHEFSRSKNDARWTVAHHLDCGVAIGTSVGNQSRSNRVVVNVAESRDELLHRVDEMTSKPVIPHMSGNSQLSVVAKGENAEDPLHDA